MNTLVSRFRTPVRYTAICGIGFILVLAPWAARNAARFDAFIPLRTGADGSLSNGFDRDYLDRPDRFSAPAPPLRETAGHMARHPWEIVPLQADKMAYLYRNDSDAIAWLQHEVPVLTASEVRRWSRIADYYFYAVGATALLGAALLWRRWDRRRFAAAYLVLGWTTIEVITWPESRYHLPIMPLMYVFSGYGWALVCTLGVTWVRRVFASRRSVVEPYLTSGQS